MALETQTPENQDTRDVVAAELDKLPQEEIQEVENKQEDAKPSEQVESVQEQPAQEPVQDAVQDAAQEEVKGQPYRNPFSAWKKEAQSVLTQLPPETQQYIIEREEQFHKGIQIYKNDAMFGRSIGKALSPHQEYLQEVGISPEQAISGLIASEKVLRKGSPEEKVQAFLKLAHDYGVDVNSLSQVPFNVKEYTLERQIAQQQQILEQLSQSQQTAQEAQLNQTIEQFAQTHEHFHEVNEVMADLIEKGLAYDLEDAYSKALRLSDRYQSAPQQQVASIQKVDQAAKAAKAAAVSVKGSPVGVTKQPEPKNTEDAVRLAMANLGL